MQKNCAHASEQLVVAVWFNEIKWFAQSRSGGLGAEPLRFQIYSFGPTDMTMNNDLLSTIMGHIEEARQMVTEQKGRVARLKATGVDTALAELTLRALEANLKRFQNHADWSERKEQNPPEPSRVTGE
jgi:hypothetical protein